LVDGGAAARAVHVEAMRVISPTAELRVFLGENAAAALALVDFLASAPRKEALEGVPHGIPLSVRKLYGF